LARSFSFPEPDVKADNVMFNEGTDPELIEKICDESPQIIDGEFELRGARYQIMRSQPIPNRCLWNDTSINVDDYSLCLSGFCGGEDCFFFIIDNWFTDVIL